MPGISIVIVIIIFLILVVIFLAPFYLSLNLKKEGPSIQGSYKIGWLGITLRRGRLSLPPSGEITGSKAEEMKGYEQKVSEVSAEKLPEDKEVKAKREAEKKSHGDLKHKHEHKPEPPLAPRTFVEAVPALLRLLRDLARSANIEKIFFHISFGLDDPAETAAMSGYLLSFASALGFYRANIYIEPFFEGEKLDGSFLADLKARLLWIALALIKALREETIRRLLREMARRERA